MDAGCRWWVLGLVWVGIGWFFVLAVVVDSKARCKELVVPSHYFEDLLDPFYPSWSLAGLLWTQQFAPAAGGVGEEGLAASGNWENHSAFVGVGRNLD